MASGATDNGPADCAVREAPARPIAVADGFSLATTCGPVAWAGGRWPNVDWLHGGLIWVGWEGESVVWRAVEQSASDMLRCRGSAATPGDRDWAARVLGVGKLCPPFGDQVVEALRNRLLGLRPFAAGSLFDGLISSIVGQSISVAAAAVAERRLAALFAPPVELAGRAFWPFPRADQLAEATSALIRTSGVTWRRAEAIVAAARVALADGLPDAASVRADPDGARRLLRSLPLVGPWTVESALLWGIGFGDAHPTGDVALLRAARRAYDRPDLTLKGLDALAEPWRPARGWAARLLWTDLLGVAG